MYGCHDLERDDHDGDPSKSVTPRWGGVDNAAASKCPTPPAPVQLNPQELNVLNIPQHVRQLQEDLRTLGFSVVGTPAGSFDRLTFWAVREFQSYAKMDTVAKVKGDAMPKLKQGAHLAAAQGTNAGSNLSEYVNSLEAVKNDGAGHYTGPVSGVVNQATRDALDHWLQNNFRCPVIIEAWTMKKGQRSSVAASNVWAHDSHPSSSPRFFVRDFSGYFVLPAGHDPDEMHVIGDFVKYMKWSGPRAQPPNHCFADAEMLPEALTGNANPTGATLSCYKVVRSVCENENLGFFDCVNCYDNAFISVGPCHWTLGIAGGKGAFAEGELCGYLAYLRDFANDAFLQLLENFGVRIDESWTVDGVADGHELFGGGHKYAGWVSLQKEDSSYKRLAGTEEEGNYFKTWHWHYRFVAAGRAVEGYRRRMWHMARVRVRDILAAAWGKGVDDVAIPGGNGATRPARVGDVFTSERAVAFLLRWHIRYPANVVASYAAGKQIKKALDEAQPAASTLTWTGDPSAWTDDHETALIDGLLKVAPGNVKKDLEYIRDWPRWLPGGKHNPRKYALAAPIASALSAKRNSLEFDDSGLPPMPPSPPPKKKKRAKPKPAPKPAKAKPKAAKPPKKKKK